MKNIHIMKFSAIGAGIKTNMPLEPGIIIGA